MLRRRSCDVENLADFNRYYQASWVGRHSDNLNYVQPCYVSGFETPESVRLRPLTKQENGNFVVEAGFPINWETLKRSVDFGMPDIGMMQDGPTVIFRSYATPRAAKKGYRSGEPRKEEFNHWAIQKKYTVRNTGERYDWVWFAFNPAYNTLAEAEAKLAKGEAVGVPLSRTLGVFSSPKYENSLLAYKRWVVGHVVSPYLVHLKREYGDYEEDIARQTGAEVIVG